MDELERSGGLLYNKTLSQKSNIKSRVSMEQSVKNPNAYVLAQIGNLETNIDLENEFLFYSRPKGT